MPFSQLAIDIVAQTRYAPGLSATFVLNEVIFAPQSDSPSCAGQLILRH